MHAAIIPPNEALAILFNYYFINLSLIAQKIGSCIAENTISRAKVGASPTYNPDIPFLLFIYEKL